MPRRSVGNDGIIALKHNMATAPYQHHTCCHASLLGEKYVLSMPLVTFKASVRVPSQGYPNVKIMQQNNFRPLTRLISSVSSSTGHMYDFKKEGKLVPSDVVVKVLQQAMQRSENEKFLVDGFPSNEENRPRLVLDCSEEEMTRRLLNRNQGRVDDNIDTIKKRLKVYSESTLPVIDYYRAKGKLRKVDGEKSIDEVFKEVKGVFTELDKSQEQSKT
ncbi:hypothetical protein PTKIN_Ptkin12aG0031200 [Pterospermum kingtungense]